MAKKRRARGLGEIVGGVRDVRQPGDAGTFAIPPNVPSRCRTAVDPLKGFTHTHCYAPHAWKPLTSFELSDPIGNVLAMGLFQGRPKETLFEVGVKAATTYAEEELMKAAARAACRRGSNGLARSKRLTSDSYWWNQQVKEGNAKNVFLHTHTIGPQKLCQIGVRDTSNSAYGYQISPRQKPRCVTRTMANGWRERVCLKTGDGYTFGAFDVRLKNEQGQLLAEGLFSLGSMAVLTEGVRLTPIGKITHPRPDNEIYRLAARVACRKKKPLRSPGGSGDENHPLDTDFWSTLFEDGRAHPIEHRRGVSSNPIARSEGADRRLELDVEMACFEGKKRTELGHRERKADEYHDQGYELSPHDRVGAKCREARFNRNQRMKICSKRPRKHERDGFHAFDVKVLDKTNAVIGKGYFLRSRTNDVIWTMGVKGTPEAQLDINLLAARTACAQKTRLASDFNPMDSFFWRSQLHAGRARVGEVDDGTFFLSPQDACKGTHQYGPKGVVESLRRRPQLLQGLPRSR